jgi:hypothetical protein
VHVEVDLRGAEPPPQQLADLRRTVENTIHVVLMGAPPLRRHVPPPRRGQQTGEMRGPRDGGLPPPSRITEKEDRATM